MRKQFFYILLISVFFISCTSNEGYFKYQTLDNQIWHKDSILIYEFNIENLSSNYDINLHIRHESDFPYQNIWFFVEHESLNDSNILRNDTIQYYLADDFGKWLGSGVGSLKELNLKYLENIAFPDSGKYRVSIKHAMRDSVLLGINNVGFSIEKR